MTKKKLALTLGLLSLVSMAIWILGNQPLIAQTVFGQLPPGVTKRDDVVVLPVDPNTGELLSGTRATVAPSAKTHKSEDSVRVFSNPSLEGRICYALNNYKTPPDYNLVLRTLSTDFSKVENYSITNTDLNAVDEPQFSPDGKYIAFKIGDLSGQYPNYHFYVLNLENGKLNLASKNSFNVPKLSWSPDGKYICLIRGGDAKGLHYHEGEGPLELISIDWRTAKETTVARDDTVLLGFDWAAPHTLFYTAQREPLEQNGSQETGKQSSSIYSVDVERGAKRLILDQAFHPVISPSGERIAFFGPEISATSPRKTRKFSTPSLSVAQRDGKQRKSLNVQAGELPSLVWGQDESIIFTVANGQEQVRGQVVQWNTASGVKKVIGAFKSTTYKEDGQEPLKPDFLPLKSLVQGLLICRINNVVGANADFYETQQTLQSMNLETGEVKVWATGKGVSSLDWSSSN